MQRASKRMVLSRVPDQPLHTDAGAATPCVLRDLADPARQSSASRVRGYLERVERMRDETAGRQKQTHFMMKMRLRNGLALTLQCGILLCGMMGAAATAHAQSAASWDKH